MNIYKQIKFSNYTKRVLELHLRVLEKPFGYMDLQIPTKLGLCINLIPTLKKTLASGGMDTRKKSTFL
jgi:hypothetical protein